MALGLYDAAFATLTTIYADEARGPITGITLIAGFASTLSWPLSAERLRHAGVPVKARREPGMVHNFLLWDLVAPSCAAADDRVADDLAEVVRGVSSPPRLGDRR